MAFLQKEFPDDENVLLLSYSITPEIDTVQDLKLYGEKHGAISKKWFLIGGERKTIYDLGRTKK